MTVPPAAESIGRRGRCLWLLYQGSERYSSVAAASAGAASTGASSAEPAPSASSAIWPSPPEPSPVPGRPPARRWVLNQASVSRQAAVAADSTYDGRVSLKKA